MIRLNDWMYFIKNNDSWTIINTMVNRKLSIDNIQMIDTLNFIYEDCNEKNNYIVDDKDAVSVIIGLLINISEGI